MLDPWKPVFVGVTACGGRHLSCNCYFRCNSLHKPQNLTTLELGQVTFSKVQKT